MTNTRVWFITGASRGLGRAFTQAALANGDRVIGVARDISPLQDLADAYPDRLVRLPLDVADRLAVQNTVQQAAAAFGRLDVIVNNAGGMLYGMHEEATEQQIRAQFDVSFFGAVWVTQAVLPFLRAQGSGHILQITTMGTGGGVAGVGFYTAAKSALDSLSQSLAMEVEPFGIKVTIVQPGGYNTDLFGKGTTATEPNPVYDPVRARLAELWDGTTDPDPDTAAPVIMELVDLPDPPLRLIVGSRAFDLVQQLNEARTTEYESWETLSRKALG
jgi:NAD(P)-dependent dehydrogenase (short-subunit alcohol dehydrogenase family)